MKTSALLLGLLMVGSALGAEEPPKPAASPAGVAASSKLPAPLAELEARYAKAGTLIAKFTQVSVTQALQQKKTSTGVIRVKRPNKVHWQTEAPDPSILASDGRKFWFYTPPFDEGERGQVIVRKSSQVQSRLAQALLSGSFSSLKSARIQPKGDNAYELTFSKGTAGTLVRATLEIDPEQKVIRKVMLQHRDGNTSEITLNQVDLGQPIADSVFRFVPPPNTDQVTE